MKATGIVRKMDNLGRIVIPKETRRNLQVDSGDVLEIFVEEDAIILQKYQSYGTCPITGEISPQNIKLADGKLTLSPEGAKQLMEELEQYKVTV
ncbi:MULTISPECIES: AbrB/MazE/SpoVT family DNA-binding domain-containing protein [Bacillus]|uniref:AbrB/MazE/SpoVT family DNA-binding domain-containing protein n=3 Tax=Bacillus cereus group TaxID=86661 RepID=A0A2B9DHJ3_BACCE|nr:MULTISPECIES: AbrB/MazE/SpoVT family DNA-binding domain-containing protein [Bacillus]AHA69992.1 putative transcriptional regulator [Bacillus thuringiensis YBT-1518]MBG9486187.1 AbrB family transcriptional regulator [Bacillus thuringiensis]MDA2639328.1 AbrB/MazE/SpoVT family DNA-binding domain-containing protein [Bacillus cereus]MEC5308490.1 AbrB/MazE/SpoVT family DNA-binding domain-containing protein [Bacillus thuringiensis]MED3090065.1 AbrB/MazE/SpoVT family DNA-binding domain-containing p